MSIVGYFDSVIRIWYEKEKHTPTMKSDMKDILRQFRVSLDHEEIPEDRIEDLKEKFRRIHDEVYT